MPLDDGRTYKSITFGSYCADFKDILKEALDWVRDHPEISIPMGNTYADEGYYMTIFWEVADELSM